MRRWPRSFVVLAMAFASTVAITTGLVVLVVQDRATSLDAASETPAPTIVADVAPMGTGGSLAVSGDREANFTLDHDSYEVSINPDFERGFARVEFGRFSLIGEDAAIHFAADPLEIEQIDLDGLAFYPEPDACTMEPGELNPAIGVASARLECVGLTDIREEGTVTIEGGIALPADLLGMRGDLPPSGGRILVGSRTLEFSDGRVLLQEVQTEETSRYALFLYGDDEASSIGFERDPESSAHYLTYIVIDEELFDIADDACAISTSELGRLNPITTVLEFSIRCDQLDLGAHGLVTIGATLVIDLIVDESLSASR